MHTLIVGMNIMVLLGHVLLPGWHIVQHDLITFKRRIGYTSLNSFRGGSDSYSVNSIHSGSNVQKHTNVLISGAECLNVRRSIACFC